MPTAPHAFTIRFAAFVAAGLLTVARAASGQQIVTGRAIFSYQVFGTEDLSSRGFHQIYDVDYQRNVTDPLRLRLSFRGEGNEGSQEFSTFQTSNSVWQLRPLGELTYSLPRLNLLARYELLDTKASFDEAESRRKTERIYTTLGWTPDQMPALSLTAEQRTDVDRRAGLDQKEGILFQSTRYEWHGVTIGQTARVSDFRLGATDFDRKTINLQGQLRYDNSLREGRVSISGGAVAGTSRIDERGGPGTSVSVPTQVPIVAALTSRDDTPLDSRDQPLIPFPRLTDGDLRASAGIVIGGPEALAYQNIALDLGRVVGLDTLRVFVRDSTGNLVPIPGLVRWDLYTSGEGLDWAPVKTGARTLFIGSLSAYEVSFVKTSARFFKVVSFGTNPVEALVTEVQAFFHTDFSQTQTRRTDVRFVSADLNLSAKATNWLTLHYSGLLNDYRTAQPDRADFNTRDTDHVASIQVTPSRPLDMTLRYERRSFAALGIPDQTLEGYWGIFQYAANRNWHTSLEASRTTEHGSQELSADTLRLHEYIRLYRAIELALDGGIARDEFPLQSLSDRRVFANAVSYVQLTGAIRLTAAANFQRTRFSGEGSAILPSLESRDGRYYGEIFFRPSGQLLLSGRLGYVTSEFFSGMTKTYRVEWYPFARGTIGFGTIYDEDIETNGTYRRFRRVQILPHWVVNRHVTVNLNYNYLILFESGIGSPVETKTRQFYATLTWIL